MLEVIKEFQKRYSCKPIIVADAVMLSKETIQILEHESVKARLANT